MSDTKEIPRLTLHHRLDIALDHSGVGVSEMADFLGVSRNTITNYIHGKTRPNKATLMTWADRCNVDFDWLEKGGMGESDTGAHILCELTAELVGQLDFFTSPLELCAA